MDHLIVYFKTLHCTKSLSQKFTNRFCTRFNFYKRWNNEWKLIKLINIWRLITLFNAFQHNRKVFITSVWLCSVYLPSADALTLVNILELPWNWNIFIVIYSIIPIFKAIWIDIFLPQWKSVQVFSRTQHIWLKLLTICLLSYPD